MTPENFVYWLQGFMELQNPETISLEQVKIIQDHLNLVFKKETPIRLPSGVIQKDKIPSSKDIQLCFNFEAPISC